MIKLPKPVPQILFFGGTFGLLSSIPNNKFFGDLTLGIAPNELIGWNAGTLCAKDAPNAWWLLNPIAGECAGGHPTMTTSTATLFSDRWFDMLKMGNGGPEVWGSSFTTTTCEDNFPFSCYPLVPFEVAIIVGALAGGYQI